MTNQEEEGSASGSLISKAALVEILHKVISLSCVSVWFVVGVKRAGTPQPRPLRSARSDSAVVTLPDGAYLRCGEALCRCSQGRSRRINDSPQREEAESGNLE